MTINGNGFGTGAEVFIGEDECNNVNVAGDQITCDFTLTMRGVQNIQVFIDGKGKANGSFTYDYVTEVTNIEPTSGHLSGIYSVFLALSTANCVTVYFN